MGDYKSTRNNANTNTDNQEELGQTQSFTSHIKEEKQKEKESSKKVAKTAAKGAATYFAGPLGGAAVDKLAQTKAGDKILNKGGEALNKIPGMGKTAKKLDESGAVDTIDKGIDVAGGLSGGGAGSAAGQGAGAIDNAGAGKNLAPDTAKNLPASGATESGGSSSSLGGDSSFLDDATGLNSLGKKKKDNNKKEDQEQEPSGQMLKGFAQLPLPIKAFIGSIIGLLVFILIIVTAIGGVSGGSMNQYTDALAISQLCGLPAGDYDKVNVSFSAKSFYNRVKDIRDEYASQGKNVDPLLLVSVYYVSNSVNEQKYTYDHMSKQRLREIADAMFDENNTYSEETFKNNLTNKIFLEYFPEADEETRKGYAESVYEYIKNYYEIIGYNKNNVCAPLGTCTYDIPGFYIYGKGNVAKNLTLSNLKVRLMESGTANGHNYGGTFGKAMDGEELVDFEKYVLGVAYAEIGSGAPDEAVKAQMVAARSYILARSTDIGGWRKITQEGNQWIIQAANSTQDQVYCDPDQGCSSNNGQWGMVHSGQGHNNGYSKPALDANSRLRTLANETAGEVLVNSQGYIIYAGFLQTEQTKMTNLANQGYNYKQILLEVYNSGNRQYGATDIKKMSCNNSEETCANGVTGDFASWKQISGPWVNTPMGRSGKTIKQIGCLATSVAIQIARSGVPTNIQGEFNPGTFVEFMNSHGGIDSGGNFNWAAVSTAAPTFKFINKNYVLGYSKDQKYNVLTGLINSGCYVVAEVKGTTGQHWVAIASAQNGEIDMMDPASNETKLWNRYNWKNTSNFACFKVG